MGSPQRDLRIGLELNGRYRITELLGEGGMGLVYRGERLQLGRPVAIKFLHTPYAKSAKYKARFEREARAMSKLSHPYCVSVIDFGVHDEPYIVMDFVVGVTLRDLMDRERVSPQRAIQLTRQVLAGLAHAHGQGVVHRDIKPGNIMIGEATGVGDHVRIFDFGLAKLHDPTSENDQSAATVIGTPAYMAPEQTRAEPIDARADLYAVGILLFELLTGEKPFVGDDAYEVIRMQREDAPPKLRARAPQLSAELETVLERALQKHRDERFQTAHEFALALEAVPEVRTGPLASLPDLDTGPREASKVISAAAAAPLGTPSKQGRRRAVIGLALVGLVGGFVYLTTRGTGSSGEAARRDELAMPLVKPRVEPPSVGPAPLIDAAIASDESLDAGAPEGTRDELTAEELAAADQTLSALTEPVLDGGVGVVPNVRSVSDVHRLIEQKRLDAAIVGLRQLHDKSPNNPYYAYLLGDLYFDRGSWTEGLAKYREAIELSDRYRHNSGIHRNAIRALGVDATYPLARVLLLEDLGDPALSSLANASVRDASPIIQRRTRLLAGELVRARAASEDKR